MKGVGRPACGGEGESDWALKRLTAARFAGGLATINSFVIKPCNKFYHLRLYWTTNLMYALSVQVSKSASWHTGCTLVLVPNLMMPPADFHQYCPVSR